MGEEICASAARISTTQGDAIETFEKAIDNANNQNLIKKVLSSGHKSLIEHAVFTIAMCNVSAYVEQFFIEFRLASFTIKSRRYVDFGEMGYYIPSDLSEEDAKCYHKYMDFLFQSYKTLVEQGVPKEDARFLLPYSFNSNFYCTINARELAHIIRAIKFGRGYGITELQDIANQIVEQIETLFPVLLYEFEEVQNRDDNLAASHSHPNVRDKTTFVEAQEMGVVELVASPQKPKMVLDMASIISGSSEGVTDIKKLIDSKRPRELEHLVYTFRITNVSLSGITHIVRHRMQSIVVPSLQSIEHNRYIIPKSLQSFPISLELYKKTLEYSGSIIAKLKGSTMFGRYGYYFAVSGSVMDIMTTINARELLSFIKLRSCNRAQWEIQSISCEILRQIRKHFPDLFIFYGPSCYSEKGCPEGRMACGKMEKTIDKFRKM